MSSRVDRPTGHNVLWSILALAVVLWQAPAFVRSLYPPSTITFDFYQDWASARNVLEGEPIYADISLTIERYLGWRLPDDWPARFWRRNYHPPPAVLLTIPFARFSYPTAFLLWSVVSLVTFAAAAWLVLRECRLALSVETVLAVSAVLLCWYPFQQQMMQGQVNLVLLALLTGAWVAHRSGRPLVAGAVLGVATAIKLFPGLLIVYFALRRQWKVIGSCLASFGLVTVLCVIVFGVETYSVYLRDVLPESEQWLSHWHNVSLMALWTKLFNPGPAGGHISPVWDSPAIARAGGWLSCIVVVSLLASAVIRARSVSDLDRTFGLTVTAMLLVSPITWSQNLVLLLFPVTLLLTMLPTAATWSRRWALVVILLTLFVPPHWVWQVLIAGGWPDGSVRPWQTLTALAFQCYALLGLFVLQLLWNERASVRPPMPEHS